MSKIGCSWSQLELRGQQNATKTKKIFGTKSSLHTFVVERENDGNSLLRFMKVVVPEYRELIPPPCLTTGFRPVQCRHNARIQNTESIGVAAPRQFRQSTETTMALNAFSDLEAIAEMGAGTDDMEAQVSEMANRPPSKLTGRCSPNAGIAFSLAQQNASALYDQRMRTEHQIMAGGNSESPQLAQMSLEQQQRQRFGMNVVYRQQQQPKQPLTRMGGVNPMSSGRLMMDSQLGSRHSSNSDVFNFVPDLSPFEDTPTPFGNMSANQSYQSPTGGVARRRGRGRRAGNFGDRQPSTSSSVEHEGTPESPSEFGTLRKQRGTGNSGQRRPRKPRKPMNVSFEQQEGISRSPFHNSEMHSIIGQVPSHSANYITSQIEDDFRSKMMTVYEMGFCESSSDDEEMDPPPPPKDLMIQPRTSEPEHKVPSESVIPGGAIGAERADGNDETSGKKCLTTQTKCKVSSSQSNGGGGEQPTDSADPPQNAALLQDIKLISATPSSASSSPSFSQLSEQSEYRSAMALIEKTEMDTAQKQRTVENAKLSDIYDNEVISTNSSKKKEIELARLKQIKDVQTNNSLTQVKLSLTSCYDRPSKEVSVDRKDGAEPPGAKRPALVLKIKKEGASSAASTKHSSSSSSPSSTSSSTAATSALPVLPIPQQQQSQQNEPVARLSSNAAPPSKYKQQRQLTKRPTGKDETAATVPVKKKQRKTADAEGRSLSPSPIQQHRPSTTSSSTGTAASTKWSKEGGVAAKSGNNGPPKKESTVPNVLSQITAPFPNLKNFKIPKVIENADSPAVAASTSNYNTNKGGPEQQQGGQLGGSQSTGEKNSRNKFGTFKSSDYFEQRRPGGGAKQTTKGAAGHPSTHYQYSDKFMGSSGGSFQSHQYNRQRTPKQHQVGGGGRHMGGGSELPRKHGPTPSSTRPMPSSSTAGHRFSVQFQQHSREAGQVHHHPLAPPQLQHFPLQQQQQQFSNIGWQAVQPSTGEFFHQQQQNGYLPQQQRVDWIGQAHDQAEQRQPAAHSAAMRPGQIRTTDRQSANNNGNCREEDRTDNSPSTGSGLQIVDDE